MPDLDAAANNGSARTIYRVKSGHLASNLLAYERQLSWAHKRYYSHQFAAQVELFIVTTVNQLMQQILKRYPTTIEEDEAQLAQELPPRHLFALRIV